MAIIMIRTVIVYFSLLVTMRLLGKRQLGEMELSEFVLAALIADLANDHELVVTLEDGVIAGGFGEKVARVAAAHGLKVLVKGAPKKFEDRFDPKDLLTRAGLTVEKISADVLAHA